MAQLNKAIKAGLTPEAAALTTFTGGQASSRSYKNVSIDYMQSKVNPDGTFENATVNFSK